MYKNVNAELARRGWSRKELANKTGIRYMTLVAKLSGKSPLLFDEAVRIKNALDIQDSLDDLFFID
jgi:hypothetical protein